jgi:hypothetical protein
MEEEEEKALAETPTTNNLLSSSSSNRFVHASPRNSFSSRPNRGTNRFTGKSTSFSNNENNSERIQDLEKEFVVRCSIAEENEQDRDRAKSESMIKGRESRFSSLKGKLNPNGQRSSLMKKTGSIKSITSFENFKKDKDGSRKNSTSSTTSILLLCKDHLLTVILNVPTITNAISEQFMSDLISLHF